MAHLDEHKLLSDKQHAVRKWHSCETQLATVVNDWAKILDNKGQVTVQMTLFPRLGVAGISTPWLFRYPEPVKMSISIAFSPDYQGLE